MEHQSSLNPNMALRLLLYAAGVYKNGGGRAKTCAGQGYKESDRVLRGTRYFGGFSQRKCGGGNEHVNNGV